LKKAKPKGLAFFYACRLVKQYKLNNYSVGSKNDPLLGVYSTKRREYFGRASLSM
jgi:hypothetical protein